jgi:hypothetical protein
VYILAFSDEGPEEDNLLKAYQAATITYSTKEVTSKSSILPPCQAVAKALKEGRKSPIYFSTCSFLRAEQGADCESAHDKYNIEGLNSIFEADEVFMKSSGSSIQFYAAVLNVLPR